MFDKYLSDIILYKKPIFLVQLSVLKLGWPVKAVQKYFYHTKIFVYSTTIGYSSKIFVK